MVHVYLFHPVVVARALAQEFRGNRNSTLFDVHYLKIRKQFIMQEKLTKLIMIQWRLSLRWQT